MKRNEVYLTKSFEAAGLIYRGLCEKHAHAPGLRTECGAANDAEIIPAIYFEQGYFYARAEWDSDKSVYELTVC